MKDDIASRGPAVLESGDRLAGDARALGELRLGEPHSSPPRAKIGYWHCPRPCRHGNSVHRQEPRICGEVSQSSQLAAGLRRNSIGVGSACNTVVR